MTLTLNEFTAIRKIINIGALNIAPQSAYCMFNVDIVDKEVVYHVSEKEVDLLKEEVEKFVNNAKTYFDYDLDVDEMICLESVIKKLGICHLENKIGLTNERYKQMMEFLGEDFETVASIAADWGVTECNNGYAIFDYDNTGLLGICKLDDVGAFESDIDAATKAKRDGIPIIPENELPEDFDMRWGIWIDTEENRQEIEKYCN